MMTKRLILPYPPSANHYLRHTGATYRTAEANAYRKQAQLMAMVAGIRERHYGPIAIHAVLHPRLTKDGTASKTVLDLSNCLKVAEDALQGIAYENDKQVVRILLERGAPLENGGLTLEVTPMEIEP